MDGLIKYLLQYFPKSIKLAKWDTACANFANWLRKAQGVISKPVAILILFLLFSSGAWAQTTTTSTNSIDISTIISKLTLHEAVGYDIKSGNVTSYTSADLLDWKGLSLSGGYSTSSAIVASIDYDIGGLSKLGITSPLLSVVDLRLGMFIGLADISLASSDGSAERNKLSWGPEVTIVAVKF
jgi:hypothetical protein